MLSVLQIGRHFAAVLHELGDHLFVQPDVHRRRVVLVAGIVQLGGERAARRQAAVEIQHFQKIDDRMFPVEPLVMLGGKRGQHRVDIDGRDRHCRGARCGACRRSLRRGWRRGGRRCLRRWRGRSGSAAVAQDRGNDTAENAHSISPVALPYPAQRL